MKHSYSRMKHLYQITFSQEKVFCMSISKSFLPLPTSENQINAQQNQGQAQQLSNIQRHACGFIIKSNPNRAPKKIIKDTPVISPTRFCKWYL